MNDATTRQLSLEQETAGGMRDSPEDSGRDRDGE
jgi:hypothetical protein